MGTTYVQVFAKSWTCGNSSGLLTILVSLQWVSADDVVEVISSKASCGPHTTSGLIDVLPPEYSLAFFNANVRLGPTSPLLSLSLPPTSLFKRKHHFPNALEF